METGIYLDEDAMDADLVGALRSRKIDIVTALEADMIGESDENQLRYAAEHQRAIYSFNVADYCRIHRTWLTEGRIHYGMILAQQRMTVRNQVRCFTRLLNQRTAEQMRDHVEFLSNWSE